MIWLFRLKASLKPVTLLEYQGAYGPLFYRAIKGSIMQLKGRVLIIAGSDSGGGAGIQADIKAVSAMGSFAATALTAITAQNTLGVQAVHALPSAIIQQQISAVLDDIGADALKIGMLGTDIIIQAVFETLEEKQGDIPLVLDPVMVAKGGASLLENNAVTAMKKLLLPKAFLITPNIPEAEILAGCTIYNTDDMTVAAKAIQALGARNVLLKGGHMDGDRLIDVLLQEDGTIKQYETKRIATKHTHGTGCSMASALTAKISQGIDLAVAVGEVQTYIHQAIKNAPNLGGGHGPLNHFWSFN